MSYNLSIYYDLFYKSIKDDTSTDREAELTPDATAGHLFITFETRASAGLRQGFGRALAGLWQGFGRAEIVCQWSLRSTESESSRPCAQMTGRDMCCVVLIQTYVRIQIMSSK
jgi:hypothetical protein